jgi:hypothetical protein
LAKSSSLGPRGRPFHSIPSQHYLLALHASAHQFFDFLPGGGDHSDRFRK